MKVKLERRKNSIRNVKWGIVNKFVTILFPFIMRTVLIYTMGTEYLGLSSLFSAILQVLSLSELGIGSVMVFELYEPIAKDDFIKIRKILKLYRKIYNIIGGVILIIGICLLPFLKILIKGDCPADVNIYALYILYLLNTSFSYLFFTYRVSVLSAYQRRDIVSNIGTIIHIALYSVQLFCLFNYHNYYAYVIWLPVFTIIEKIISIIYINKHYPECKPDGNLEKDEVKNIFRNVKDLFGHKLSNVVTNSVDTIVISSFLGLNMVTIYNNYYYLMSAVSGILDMLYQGILAGIGNSLVSETKEKNRKDFDKFFLLNAWIVGWCSICFLCLYQSMIELWMGKDLMLPFTSVILLYIYFYVWKIRQTILVYKDAAGMWNIDNKKPYVEILVNLVVNIVLVNFIGVNGVIISTILSMTFVSLIWESKAFFKAYFNESSKHYIIRIIIYFIVTTVIATLTYFICTLITNKGIIWLLLKGIICIIIPNLVLVIICRNNSNFRKVIELIKKK